MIYHVDPVSGADTNSGATPREAWRTLARVSRQSFRPDDRVLLRRGGCWNEGLTLRGRAPADAPILLGAYGDGPRPRINGGETHAITGAEPISGWRISGLELTSTNDLNPTRKITGGTCGLFLRQEEPCEGLTIDDCLIHHTSGPGLFLQATGPVKAVFADTLVEHCEIHHASCGLQFWAHPNYGTDFFDRFRIAHVTVHDIGGDGIVPFCGKHGVIEYCTAYRTGLGVAPEDHSPIAIWYAWANNCLIQHCHAYDNRTGGRGADGGGFDLDGGCVDCTLQYNYSHDNEGAGYLICSWDPEHWPCTGCVCRYNLTINDGLANDYASLHFWQNVDCRIYNNTCLIRTSPALKFITSGTDTRGNLLANNLFLLDSPEQIPIVRSDHDISHNTFRNNLYYHLRGEPRFLLQDQDLSGLPAFVQAVSGENEVEGDPLLTSPAAGDVRLRPGSPGRGAGLRLDDMGSRDFYGALLDPTGPVDIGCAAAPRRFAAR